MIINSILGIQRKEMIIPENNFTSFSIFPTDQILRNYFKNYGYEFIGEYDFEKNLVVVKNNNRELSSFVRNYDFYSIINYQTKEVVCEQCSSLEVELARKNNSSYKTRFSFYSIEEHEKGMTIIDKKSSKSILTAERIKLLNPQIALVQNYGLDIIFHLDELKCYPLVKQDRNIYVGNSENTFLDMRFGMYTLLQNIIYPVSIENTDLWELVEKFPFGEVKGSRFQLLDCLFYYGIFYKSNENTQIKWYSSKQERDDVLEQLGITIQKTLGIEKEKQKVNISTSSN